MRRFILGILAIVLLWGCDTRRKIYEDKGIWVRVSLDWSQSGVSPKRATVWFYPERCDLRPVLLVTNETYDSVLLRRSAYKVLAFNETQSSFERVNLRGLDAFHSVEVYARPYSPKVSRGSTSVVNMPDTVASDSRDDFQVTQSMVLQHARPLIKFTPRRVTVPVKLIVHIKGVDNAASTGSMALLNGFSEGVKLASKAINQTNIAHSSVLNYRTVDDDNYHNGTMLAYYNTFDQVPESVAPTSVILRFRLRDGKVYELPERNVTALVRREQDNTGPYLIIEIGRALPGDSEIVLPETEDKTEPGAGFDAEIDDWGEEVNIPVEI